MTGRTVAIQFVRAAMSIASARGIDVGNALQDARITGEMMSHDLVRVTREQASAVVQALWQQTDDELLGLGPRTVARGTFRMISLALVHSRDLDTALTRFAEFSALLTDVRPELSVDGSRAEVLISAGREPFADPLVVDIALTVTHRFASWLIREQIPLTSVDLPYPPPLHESEYKLIYGIEPMFGASGAALRFDAMYLSVPIVRTETELFEFLRNSPTELLFPTRYNVTTADRVRNMLERRESGEWPTADEVARQLSVSAQHVRRLLQDEGTSFRVIQEEILRDRAIKSLVEGTETIDEIADRLGYAETSSFRRAFRRWTGVAPGSYRTVVGN